MREHPQQIEPALNEESRVQRDLFALLLAGYRAAAIRIAAPDVNRESRLCALLKEFKETRTRTDAAATTQAASECERFHRLLDGSRKAFDKYVQHQAECADDFNLLDVMNLSGKEIRHSMVLAWLLDHDRIQP